MIDPAQIRASRGLLGSEIADLAKRTELTLNGISKIERGNDAHRDSLKRIQKAFEDVGMKFVALVLNKKWSVKTCWEKLRLKYFLRMYTTHCTNDGGEMCIAHSMKEMLWKA